MKNFRKMFVGFMQETTLWDRILVTFLLVSSIGGSLFISFASAGNNDKKIIISVENKITETIFITKDTNKTYSFKFGENTGYIEVKDGAVRMLEMPKSICPKGICSDIGWIKKKYQAIVCLPNRIVVNIEERQQDTVDLITF